MHLSSRSSARFWILLVAGGAVTACTDSRVKAVDTGISRDSAIKLLTMNAAPPPSKEGPSTMGGVADPNAPANVYRRDQYLVNGVMTEILYFDPKNRHLGQLDKDTVPWKDLTPVVLIQNKVVGRGWDVFDSVAKANKLPMHQR